MNEATNAPASDVVEVSDNDRRRLMLADLKARSHKAPEACQSAVSAIHLAGVIAREPHSAQHADEAMRLATTSYEAAITATKAASGSLRKANTDTAEDYRHSVAALRRNLNGNLLRCCS